MNKQISLLAVIVITLTVVACNTNSSTSVENPRPVGNSMGKEIVALSIEIGKNQNIGCSEALKNKDVTSEAVSIVGGSLDSYSDWIMSESGQQIMQAAIAKCEEK